MSGKGSSSLKELRSLRESVLAEEKARTQALLQNLPANSNGVAEAVPDDSATEDLSPSPISVVPSPPPEPPPPPPPPRPPARAPTVAAAQPAAAAPSRPKANATKEPALIIPLTPKIQERLQRNLEGARWSPAELVMELIRVSLHRGYPGIQFGDQLIARQGTYRTIERNPFEAVLKIISGQGAFSITVRPENPDYQHWIEHFTLQEAASPEKSASQVCLFSLQTYLENVEDFRADGWTKTIPEDAFELATG